MYIYHINIMDTQVAIRDGSMEKKARFFIMDSIEDIVDIHCMGQTNMIDHINDHIQ